MRRVSGLTGVLLALAMIIAAMVSIGAQGADAASFTECPPVVSDTGCQFQITVTNSATTVASDPTQLTYNGTEDALVGIVNDSSSPVTEVTLSAEDELFGFDGDGMCEPESATGPIPTGCKVQEDTAHEKTTNFGHQCGYEGELHETETLSKEIEEFCAFEAPAGEPAGVTFPEGVEIVGYAKNGDPVTGYEGPRTWFSGITALGATPAARGVVNISPALLPGESTYFSLESPPEGGFGVGTTLTTALSASTVLQGTPVTDTATLSGAGASLAGGTVSYNVYSDEACTKLVAAAGSAALSNGAAGASSPETLAPGTYYWQASYGGDVNNKATASACTSEVLHVLAPTKTSTTQTAGGVSAGSLTVPQGTPVTDQAHISGTEASLAGGTVTYSLYKSNKCTGAALSTSLVTVAAGVAPASKAVNEKPGTYYWQATYAGDGVLNAPSVSPCGSEVLIVALKASVGGLPTANVCLSKRSIVAHPHSPRGVKIDTFEVFINGALKSRGRYHGNAIIDLIGLPKGTFHVAIVLESSKHKLYEEVRTFHTCVPKHHHHHHG